MADKWLPKKISQLGKEIEDEEKQRTQWLEMLPDIEGNIASGQGDTAEWQKAKDEILEAVAGHDQKLAKFNTELAELEAQLPKAPEPAAPKFDPEKHPLLRKTVEKVEPAKPITFNTGDFCEAQWTDRQWYKAKVQTVLGSASDPKYHVRFLDYDDTATVDRDSIRLAASEYRKRKAEAALVATPPPVVNSPHVVSGAASINPEALAAKKEANQDANAPVSRRKIGGHKALERKANDWKSFTSKGVGKSISKKDSMFRSGTAVNSRVGFTGSGAGMTKTTKRQRYNTKDQSDEEGGGDANNNTGKAYRTDERQPRSRY